MGIRYISCALGRAINETKVDSVSSVVKKRESRHKISQLITRPIFLRKIFWMDTYQAEYRRCLQPNIGDGRGQNIRAVDQGGFFGVIQGWVQGVHDTFGTDNPWE